MKQLTLVQTYSSATARPRAARRLAVAEEKWSCSVTPDKGYYLIVATHAPPTAQRPSRAIIQFAGGQALPRADRPRYGVPWL